MLQSSDSLKTAKGNVIWSFGHSLLVLLLIVIGWFGYFNIVEIIFMEMGRESTLMERERNWMENRRLELF